MHAATGRLRPFDIVEVATRKDLCTARAADWRRGVKVRSSGSTIGKQRSSLVKRCEPAECHIEVVRKQ
eukprot:7390498-Prymnesium_polylepis.1